ITEKLIQMMTAESEWVKTGIELEEVKNGIRRVAEGVAPHVVRLLADEREPMECGHPRACWVELKAEAPDGSMQGYAAECSACAGREKVREMCALVAEEECDKVPGPDSDWPSRIGDAIRQLDLTKELAPSSTEEKEKNDG
ncbi:hypothetical protein LCGC14_2777210, partial [marine sediment metagenome]